MIKSKVQNDVGHETNGNIKFSFLLKVPLFDFALSVGKSANSNFGRATLCFGGIVLLQGSVCRKFQH